METPRETVAQRPNRMFMDDPNIKWRDGKKPDYTKADKLYLQERTKQHKPGSIEEIVSNIIKTFEMEAQHKLRPEDFGVVTSDFTMNVNGGPIFTLQDLLDSGTYNLFLHSSTLYDVAKETRESSDEDFKRTFTKGFPWEVLEVIQGPPKLVFKWRHWAHMTGPFQGNTPSGDMLEMFGCTVADVTVDNKLKHVEFYHDAHPMIAKLQGKCPVIHRLENS